MLNSSTIPSSSLVLQATINANHPLAQKLLRSKKEEKQLKLAQQAYRLALLAQDMLHGTILTDFIYSNVETIMAVSLRAIFVAMSILYSSGILEGIAHTLQ